MTAADNAKSTSPGRGCRMVIGSLAIALVSTASAMSVGAAPAAHAANGSLEICPVLPYLTWGHSQFSQGEYSWTLYQVDDAGRNVMHQQGHAQGCHVVSPIGNGAYRASIQGECFPSGFRLEGMSPAVLVSPGQDQIHTGVEVGWADC